MKIAINLASRPFRRDRAILVASVTVMMVLVLTLGGLIYLYGMDRAESAQVRRDLARLNRQIAQADVEQKRMDAVLRQPQNAISLDQSVFINTLIYHKALSWSKLFSDLETTLPYNVKLTQLVPSINSVNKVTLDITAAAEKEDALIGLSMALEKSGKFREVTPHSIAQPTQAEPFYRIRITVNYAQKL